jgi:hypothetical protein
MKFKRCSHCKHKLSIRKFNKDIHRKDGLNNICRDCRANYKKKIYPQSKKQLMDKRKERKRMRYLFLFQYLNKHPCVDCGETDPVVLDFDHVRGDKIAELSKMAHGLRPMTMIEQEIEKCEVRCSNCHRRKTAVEQRWYHYIDFSTMTLKKT